MKKTYRVYCGPSIVEDVARYMKPVFGDVVSGTQDVYVKTGRTRDEVLAEFKRYGVGWTWRDVREV